jgi:hypothetical protein
MSFQAYKHIHCVASKKRHESFISYRKYGSNNSWYKCELCAVTVYTDNAMDVHCYSREHENRLGLVLNVQNNEVALQCAQLQHRIDRLSARSWQLEVQSRLYPLLLNQTKTHNSETKGQMRSAEAALLKYERRETVALLELAVWKALCMVNDDHLTKRKDYLSWKVWSTVGWKENKNALQNANDIGIIFMAVLPFLPGDNGRNVPVALQISPAADDFILGRSIPRKRKFGPRIPSDSAILLANVTGGPRLDDGHSDSDAAPLVHRNGRSKSSYGTRRVSATEL